MNKLQPVLAEVLGLGKRLIRAQLGTLGGAPKLPRGASTLAQGGQQVRRAAVLGAGVMGAQIAAHLANAGLPVLLFDLPDAEGNSTIAQQGKQRLRQLDPAPLASLRLLEPIECANYGADLARLQDCDLVIEAVAEQLELKLALYRQIAPHLGSETILASNTSGLSIAALAQGLPEPLQARFCGVHFFNPPRYMRLVELIAAPNTQPALLDALEGWLTSRLGKGVVRALDTPNFIANRVGVFAMLAAMHHTEAMGLGFEVVDALTGTRLGRPKSATYRTADVVGLDTLRHVIHTLRDRLPDDPWHPHYRSPDWLDDLIAQGRLGQKTGAGIYRKEGKTILSFNRVTGGYDARPGSRVELPADVLASFKLKHPGEQLRAWRQAQSNEGQFLWAVTRDLLHYCACHLADIATSARDVDLAMRWGFGWAQGPFELWQQAGWSSVAQMMQADLERGLGMSNAPLPPWALDPARTGVHSAAGSFSAARHVQVPRNTLPGDALQLKPVTLAGEVRGAQEETIWSKEGARLWRLPEVDEGVAILSFTSKMHAIGDEVLDAIQAAVREAEQHFDALVLWHEPPFAVGANLLQVLVGVKAGAWGTLEAGVDKFQRITQMLKFAEVPTVAAVSGLALGGGCEVAMHCHARVAHLESYVGLVEAGVGLLPAGGGCKELALRAARLAAQTESPAEVFPFLQPLLRALAQGTVAKSALEAQELGLLDLGEANANLVMHADELLARAIACARALAHPGFRPQLPAQQVPVAGRTGIANVQAQLANLREGGHISAHDQQVTHAIAQALCGGDLDAGERVNETWLLTQERRLFMTLLRTPATQARIAHMLEHGKPLRN